MAAFNPESAGGFGVAGVDDNVVDLGPQLYERNLAASGKLLATLESALGEEQDRRVRQDLGILIKSVRDNIETAKLEREHMLPYLNLSQTVFGGVRALIDPQIARERYPAAIERIRKYAGLATGTVPVGELARDRSAERFSRRRTRRPLSRAGGTGPRAFRNPDRGDR